MTSDSGPGATLGSVFDPQRPVLITGGAGFIGANVADRLLTAGQPVIVLDSLARAGVTENVAWLRGRHGARMHLEVGDVRDAGTVGPLVARSGAVIHLAAQVAVTTSLDDPREDFDVNAAGTLTVLEAVRATRSPPPLLYTSTNKVYGPLTRVRLARVGERYLPDSADMRARGIAEDQPLDFHSPYGCSKGAADQYVLDYARVYGLSTVVFRMSCIYGPLQKGNEDQGWVAHFARQALQRQMVTIYGDGRQVRDALFVGDLVDAMVAAFANMPAIRGRVFNIGGGVANTMTPGELMELLANVHGVSTSVRFAPWRPADQRYYVSDTGAFAAATGWAPRVGVDEGVRRLCQWLSRGEFTETRVPFPASAERFAGV
jgi:CDP-paratose 2-epimerase